MMNQGADVQAIGVRHHAVGHAAERQSIDHHARAVRHRGQGLRHGPASRLVGIRESPFEPDHLDPPAQPAQLVDDARIKEIAAGALARITGHDQAQAIPQAIVQMSAS